MISRKDLSEVCDRDMADKIIAIATRLSSYIPCNYRQIQCFRFVRTLCFDFDALLVAYKKEVCNSRHRNKRQKGLKFLEKMTNINKKLKDRK